MERSRAYSESLAPSSQEPAEYIVDRRSLHGAPKESAHRRTSRIRTAYFITASVWGFGIGVGALAVAQRVSGQPVAFTPGLIAAHLPALALTVVGGAVAAAAYREARNLARR